VNARPDAPEDDATWSHVAASRSVDDTLAVAAALGRSAAPGLVIALAGEMGAGKTTFVRGLAAGLDSPDEVASPTYTLVHHYRGRLPLQHFDAWLTARAAAFLEDGGALGFEEGGVSAVEWASEVEDFLPPDRLEVVLRPLGADGRAIAARARGPSAALALSRWREVLGSSFEPAGGPSVGGGA
jgi:tRNA threonylcarbamoyladenosine biosynthesis protein TsaE